MKFRVLVEQDEDGIFVAEVPAHKELPKGTLRAIIRQAGLTVEEFRSLL